MSRLLSFYHKLPSQLWPLVASAKAYKLRRRRYGSVFRRALPHISARQFSDRNVWEDFQSRQLHEILSRAVKAVPAYRGNPDMTDYPPVDAMEVLKQWPLMDTDHFRNNPDQYRDEEYGFRNCIELFTSGTTGTPKKIVRDSRAEQLNYAYTEARWRNNAGVTLDDRWVMIGGQLVTPVERNRPPFWVPAYPTKQLYASSYHLKPEFADDYMRAIKKWRPAYILGYASSLNALARFVESSGTQLNLKCVISNAEPLYQNIRERLQRTFQCEVFDTYGATEGAFMGFECSSGRMHISPDFGVFEILRDDGTPCEPGEMGRAVVTGLTNRAMPLIRYSNGDSVAWSKAVDCSCGCSFPIIESIEGRTDDLIILPDGREVGRLDPVFKGDLPIQEAQIVQKPDSSIEVLIVKETPQNVDGFVGDNLWIKDHEESLMKELRKRLGYDIQILIKYVDRIPRGKNNKFKAVVREH